MPQELLDEPFETEESPKREGPNLLLYHGVAAMLTYLMWMFLYYNYHATMMRIWVSVTQSAYDHSFPIWKLLYCYATFLIAYVLIINWSSSLHKLRKKSILANLKEGWTLKSPFKFLAMRFVNVVFFIPVGMLLYISIQVVFMVMLCFFWMFYSTPFSAELLDIIAETAMFLTIILYYTMQYKVLEQGQRAGNLEEMELFIFPMSFVWWLWNRKSK